MSRKCNTLRVRIISRPQQIPSMILIHTIRFHQPRKMQSHIRLKAKTKIHILPTNKIQPCQSPNPNTRPRMQHQILRSNLSNLKHRYQILKIIDVRTHLFCLGYPRGIKNLDPHEVNIFYLNEIHGCSW